MSSDCERLRGLMADILQVDDSHSIVVSISRGLAKKPGSPQPQLQLLTGASSRTAVYCLPAADVSGSDLRVALNFNGNPGYMFRPSQGVTVSVRTQGDGESH